jgi:OOP family OmpA-OmpF porin
MGAQPRQQQLLRTPGTATREKIISRTHCRQITTAATLRYKFFAEFYFGHPVNLLSRRHCCVPTHDAARINKGDRHMYRKTISTLLIAAAPLALGLEAHAQSPAGTTGFYGGLGAGRTDIDIGTAGIAGSTDKNDTAWKIFGGYQFNQNLAVEGGYVDLGKASVVGTQGGAPASATLDAQVWQAAAVGSLPLNPQIALTGKLGLAYADTDTSGSIGGAAFGGSDSKVAPTYGFGLRYDVTKTFGIRGEWERFVLGSSGLGSKNDADLYSLNAIFRF